LAKSETFRVVDGAGFTFAPIPTRALELIPAIGPYAFTVFSLMVSFTRPGKDNVYPSLTTLVDRTGFSKNTVLKAIDTLSGHCLISVDREEKHNVYTLRPTSEYRDTILSPDEPIATPVGSPHEPMIGSRREPKEEVSSKKKTDPRIREFFIKWASTGIIDPTPKGQIAGRIKALPPEITVAALCGAVDTFIAKPDPWVKATFGITFRGFMQQLPKIISAHNDKLRAHARPQPQTRVILTDEGPKRVPV
jgi:hypothetical protein